MKYPAGQSESLTQAEIDYFGSADARAREARDDPERFRARTKHVYVTLSGQIEYLPPWARR